MNSLIRLGFFTSQSACGKLIPYVICRAIHRGLVSSLNIFQLLIPYEPGFSEAQALFDILFDLNTMEQVSFKNSIYLYFFFGV